VGYIAFDLETNRVDVARLVVHPDFRRKGLGTLLLGAAVKCLTGARRYIRIACRDDLDAAHLALKARGFVAIGVAWGKDGDRDEYIFTRQRSDPWKWGQGDGREGDAAP
jgi:GNAT superfamily N-acetyltransferase